MGCNGESKDDEGQVVYPFLRMLKRGEGNTGLSDPSPSKLGLVKVGQDLAMNPQSDPKLRSKSSTLNNLEINPDIDNMKWVVSIS